MRARFAAHIDTGSPGFLNHRRPGRNAHMDDVNPGTGLPGAEDGPVDGLKFGYWRPTLADCPGVRTPRVAHCPGEVQRQPLTFALHPDQHTTAGPRLDIVH